MIVLVRPLEQLRGWRNQATSRTVGQLQGKQLPRHGNRLLLCKHVGEQALWLQCTAAPFCFSFMLLER